MNDSALLFLAIQAASELRMRPKETKIHRNCSFDLELISVGMFIAIISVDLLKEDRMKMRIKITSIVLVLIMAAVMGAYAKGQADKFQKKDAVTLTGTIVIKDRVFPELTANGKTYYVLVPRHLTREAVLKDGDQITISGNLIVPNNDANRFWDFSSTDQVVLPTKATINGKDYDLSNYGPRGPGYDKGGWGRGGMMRGYGLGNGPCWDRD
jgi:hypothetical protein